MSETSSDSPSVVIHPISPSSSLSSALSEPHSDPTSDEEPDLGAFNAVLREWTHLQPPPRIPIQIRSATSSTTPTFQPSVTGSDIRSEHSRNTRISALSGISSFTRPPSSSAQPEGSTVWAQAPIASYLLSVTPSNDDEEGSTGGEGEYTPNSMASTGLTVEIESETDFDESNGRVESSPYPFPSDSGISGVAMPVPLQVEATRIDSRETEHLEEASSTSVDRTFTVTTIRSVGDTESRLTSVQLQSQLRPTPTTEPSTSSLSNYPSHPPVYPSNRSRNPIPPRTVSDSSVTTSGSTSSSDLSLISYQISEAPSLPLVEESSSISASTGSSSIASTSMGLKTQRSMPTTASASTASLGTQRPQQQQFQPQVAPSDASNLSSTGSPLINPYSSVGFGSPLPNPYSPFPMPTSEPPAPLNHNRRLMLRTVWRQDIVDDLGTPDQPPSETLLFEPPRQWQKEFQPIVDDNDEDIQVERFAVQVLNDSTKLISSGDVSAYDHPGPSTLSHKTSYPQNFGSIQRNDRHEPHIEDEIDYDAEDVRYQSRYPYSHGPSPRSFGPALTPRGLPSSSDLRSQGPAQSTTNFATNSLVHPFGYSNQSLLQTSNQESQQQHQSLSTQHPSLVQSQFQYETNQQRPYMYATTASSIPQSTHQQSLPSSYPYTPHASAATQSSSAYAAYSSSNSPHSYPPNQAQPQIESDRNPHGYPYSLLGLHGLPGKFPSSEDEPSPTASSNMALTATVSQIPQPTQTLRQAATAPGPYNASFSDDSSTILGIEPTATAHAPAETGAEISEPSLGVLDGVLQFIAIERERARNIATREGIASSSAAEADDFNDVDSGDDGEGKPLEGEEEWKNTIENETENAQPKRKRRRKRPRTHAAATVVIVTQSIDAAGDVGASASILNAQASEGTLEHFVSTQTVSSRRKRRSKSTPASATASSSSLLSAPLDINGLQTPSIPRTKDKEFLVPPASLSRAASKKKKEVPTITILRRPEELLTRSNARSDDDDSDFDGERTPTNFGIMQSDASRAPELGVPINLTGKKGKRVGRREREKEKSKYDATREHEAAKEGDASVGTDKTFDFDNDSDENDEDGVESQDDEDEEQGDDNDSLSNLSLLKPPRRRRRRRARDTAYIHTGTGNAGSYRSIPGTPGFLLSYPDGQANDGDERVVVDGGSKQSTAEDDNNSQSKASVATEKRKRTRRRLKAVKSVPDLKLEMDIAGPSTSAPAVAAAIVAEDRTQQAVIKATRGRLGTELLGSHDPLDMDRNSMQQYLFASRSGIILMNSPPEPKKLPPPDSKRGRLLALARQLRQLFPEQSEDLGRIIQRIENPSTAQGGKTKRVVTSDAREEFEAQTGALRPKRRRARKGGHAKTGSESGTGPTGGDVFEFEDEQGDVLQDADGGISHMPEVEEEEEEVDPRGRPPKRSDTALVHVFIDHSNILIGLLSHLKKNQNRRNAMNKTRSRPLPALISKATAASGASNKTDAASAFAAVKASSSRPLPIPSNGDAGTKPVVPVEVNPIPLPSFATMSHSLPTTSVLNSYMAPRNGPSDDMTGRENNSDGYEYPCKANDESGALAPAKGSKDKRMLNHLWHAALVLILERGRPVTRRVVVASSPLYQPMESIEQLGYELRVYLRVPDLGDGQDRERYRDKSTAGKSNGSSKSAQSSPTTATSSSGIPYTKRTHVRNISGNVSTESGSGAGSGNASGGLHPYHGTPNTNLANTSRVKYREQGVDELLQLKLHQAIAASETVPEGSTIVLATGDGNVSQFTEDGFLGPVRTALRRGWKVELYAWEDGLSRAWRREFGDRSDWGQRGLFRVIEMEQFADALVEAVEQSSD